MINILVWHDNGKAGQKGYTEECVCSVSDIPELIARYESHNITVYSVDFINTSERV